MSKKTLKPATNPAAICGSTIRAGSLRLVQLASPFVNESITDFISRASDGRSLAILKDHNVRLPAGAVPLTPAN